MINKNIMQIGEFKIGEGYPAFIIAEAGVNHNGNLAKAKEMIFAAKKAGVDAIKFQTFSVVYMVTEDAPIANYQAQKIATNLSQYEMLKSLTLSMRDHQELVGCCKSQGLIFLSTPFDLPSIALLEKLDLQAYKISSGEITNTPLLKAIAQKGKPILLSTGMTHLGEVDDAIRFLESVGGHQINLLHCTSSYPASPFEINLNAIKTLRQAFQVPVGYSDHTEGIDICIAAVAIGACIIEKHFTLDKTLPGPDHQASIEPDELKNLVLAVRRVEAAMGTGRKAPSVQELETAKVARKSLVAAQDILAGVIIAENLVALKRPGTGFSAAYLPFFMGRKTKHIIKKGTILKLEDFS